MTDVRSRVQRAVICGHVDEGTPALMEFLLSPATSWLVADARGEQAIRRLVVEATEASLVLIVVDAISGLTSDIQRQSYIVSLLRIPHVVLIGGMDRVEWSQETFKTREREYGDFAGRVGATHPTCIPISTSHDDNLTKRSANMPWYSGRTVIEHLGQVDGTRNESAVISPHATADQFEATIIWLHERPMLQGRSYLLKLGDAARAVTVAPLKYSVNVSTLEHVATKKLEMNDIGVCGINLSEPVTFAPYAQNRDLGRFTLLDRATNAPLGIGLLHFALRRSENVHWQALDVNKAARAALKSQRPCVVWFTGLSGAGKSTICNLLDKRLHARGHHTYVLDGDNVRHGLNRDLGFTEADRVENVRRVAEVAHLMADAGLIVLVSFISPFRTERRMARGLMDENEFIEVFVDTPLHVAEARDPKGLYGKARRGELKNFTGVDSPYEVPEAPEIRLDTTQLTPEQAVDAIMRQLLSAGIVAAL